MSQKIFARAGSALSKKVSNNQTDDTAGTLVMFESNEKCAERM